METIGGSYSKDCVPAIRRSSKKLITDKQSTHAVIYNDDLLIEILLRLPVISLLQLKSVCKRWLSLIRDPTFIVRRSRIPTLDPSCGALIGAHAHSPLDSGKYHFLSFNSAPKSNPYPYSLTFESELRDVKILILQSCNGLFLCCTNTKDKEYYVCNPSINFIKMVPECSSTMVPQCSIKTINCGASRTRIAFDPTKSPHYKVIHAIPSYICDAGDDGNLYSVQIQTYFSETNMWSVCTCRYPRPSFFTFDNGIYWNDAIYWRYEYVFYVLYIIKPEHQTLKTIKTPSGYLYRDFKLFETFGCLLLLCTEDDHLLMDVYEMRKGHSQWLLKYHVNLNDDFSVPRRSWKSQPNVLCIVLGEREEDSFILIEDYKKIVQYKPVLKTSHDLYELESVYGFYCFQFIPSFTGAVL